MVLPCHDWLPLSSPARGRGWRSMAKRFSDNGFAAAGNVTRCSGSAGIATAASAIAARLAATEPAGNSAATPTAAISGARKDGSIIATASGTTGGAGPNGRSRPA